ncbi:unnamed protein product [Kluyveromyces dobzhanskii CBS 2104]|uniref:WGS project CCBQ000000000 data, contig 00015 n=1 Tax=Kluyveromyces dobzhanskii CBS 2104 TaxID=1427455 RepID=A0A0A8L9H7_9SACH|nr:unnamed protein product [Kluyveromyces dobzhanskii CBS 2104]
MGEITSISLEETNRIRASLGLKTIPRPAGTAPASKTSTSINAEQHVRGNNPRSVSSFPDHNLKKTNDNLQDYDKKLAHLKTSIEKSKGLLAEGDAVEDVDTDDWLAKVSESVKKHVVSLPKKDTGLNVEKVTNNSVSVPEDVKSSVDQNPVILTLKETSADNFESSGKEEEDVLENERVAQDQEDGKKIKLRQLNKDRKLNKVSIFDYSDEENDTNPRTDTLIDDPLLSEKPLPVSTSSKRVRIESDSDNDESPKDYAPIKIKKRKKKSNQNVKPRELNTVRMVKVDLLDNEEDSNDESFLPVLKVKRRTKDEASKHEGNSAELERLEMQHRIRTAQVLEHTDKTIVLDDTEEFLSSLKSEVLEKKPVNENDKPISINLKQEVIETKTVQPGTVNGLENKEPEQHDFREGVAGMLNFLKERKIIGQDKEANHGVGAKRHGNDIKKEFEVLNKITNSLKDADRNLVSNGVAFTESELSKINASQAEEIALDIQRLQQEKLKNYNPTVSLTYNDSDGNELETKEAYKQLSQSWHGTKSSKKTLDRQQKKIARRKRQLEQESYLGS